MFLHYQDTCNIETLKLGSLGVPTMQELQYHYYYYHLLLLLLLSAAALVIVIFFFKFPACLYILVKKYLTFTQ